MFLCFCVFLSCPLSFKLYESNSCTHTTPNSFNIFLMSCKHLYVSHCFVQVVRNIKISIYHRDFLFILLCGDEQMKSQITTSFHWKHKLQPLDGAKGKHTQVHWCGEQMHINAGKTFHRQRRGGRHRNSWRTSDSAPSLGLGAPPAGAPPAFRVSSMITSTWLIKASDGRGSFSSEQRSKVTRPSSCADVVSAEMNRDAPLPPLVSDIFLFPAGFLPLPPILLQSGVRRRGWKTEKHFNHELHKVSMLSVTALSHCHFSIIHKDQLFLYDGLEAQGCGVREGF